MIVEPSAPANPAEAFDGAKSGLDLITSAWTAANDAFKSGDVAGATAKAST
jgi:hypothetical protein